MDDSEELIGKLRTPEGAEQFAKNVGDRRPELAKRALRRAVQMRAEAKGAASEVERACFEAVYAYEWARSQSEKRNFRASRTWQMIDRRGIIPAVEVLVCKDSPPVGYTTLIDLGLDDLAFEAVVLKYPEHFSAQAVERSRSRLNEARRSSGPQEDALGTSRQRPERP